MCQSLDRTLKKTNKKTNKQKQNLKTILCFCTFTLDWKNTVFFLLKMLGIWVTESGSILWQKMIEIEKDIMWQKECSFGDSELMTDDWLMKLAERLKAIKMIGTNKCSAKCAW